jgi:hypothetical protein
MSRRISTAVINRLKRSRIVRLLQPIALFQILVIVVPMNTAIANRHFDGCEFILAGYEQVHGTVPLNKSKIIFLGDNHLDLTHIALHAMFLNAFAQPGDYVLVEGFDSNVVLDQTKDLRTREIKFPVTMRGWDDEKLCSKSSRLLHASHRFEIEIAKKDLANEDTSKLRKDRQLVADAFHNIAINERNKHLRHTLEVIYEKALIEGKRIFVFTGSNHLTADLPFIDSLNSFPYVAYRPTNQRQPTQNEIRAYYELE